MLLGCKQIEQNVMLGTNSQVLAHIVHIFKEVFSKDLGGA